MINFHLHFENTENMFNELSNGQAFRISPLSLKSFRNDHFDLMLWGDPIVPDDWSIDLPLDLTVHEIIYSIKGHFYYFLINRSEYRICIGNSFFSILPVYYYYSEGKVSISNNVDFIASSIAHQSIDKQFILENILFYYPLFNRSYHPEIKLLPTNHFIEIVNNNFSIRCHSSIPDLFTDNPVKWRKATGRVSEVFLASVEKYLPNEFYYTALTGGFDGRTLVSAGLKAGREFSTYSFGSTESQDVYLAIKLSALAELPYKKILLDNDYADQYSLRHGLDFINRSNGAGTFARAHYLYAVKQLSENSRFVITGNFGSEVFRTAHISGAVINPNLYKLFAASGYDEAIRNLGNAFEWNWLNRASYKHAWESLKEDIRAMPQFDPAYKSLSKNQKFYITVFNEVFRKYFGAEMVNQFHHMINRTPFLDIDFFTELLKTELSGVYSDFFTHNPFKRFKGQVTYAHIIQKTYPPFMTVLTDKGYRPVDLLTWMGKARIARSFLLKRYFEENGIQDPYGVVLAFDSNKSFWRSLLPYEHLFNGEAFHNALNGKTENRNSFFVALSQAWFVNQLMKTYGEK